MPRKTKSRAPTERGRPSRSEVVDQFVRQGPLRPEELEAAVRRCKNEGVRISCVGIA